MAEQETWDKKTLGNEVLEDKRRDDGAMGDHQEKQPPGGKGFSDKATMGALQGT